MTDNQVERTGDADKASERAPEVEAQEVESSEAASPEDTSSETGTPEPESSETGNPGGVSDGGTRPQAYLGPFTLRDVVLFGSVALMFIGSLIPVAAGPGFYSNLWNSSSLFFLGLGILLPLIVAVLFAARRLSPGTRLGVGSLSVDQFASVIALFAAAYFFIVTVGAFGFAPLLAFIGALGLVASTTFAPHLPFFKAEFAGRTEVPAHVVAREAVQPEPKPAKPAKPAKPEKQSATEGRDGPRRGVFGARAAGNREQHAGGRDEDFDYAGTAAYGDGGTDAYGDAGRDEWPSTGTAAFPAVGHNEPRSDAWDPMGRDAGQGDRNDTGPGSRDDEPFWNQEQHHAPQSFGATRESHAGTDEDDYEEEETYDAFWFAVGQTREIVDEQTGAPVFVIEPGAWVLALQDRGD
ncbi:MAG TPA: hypothetical protein VFM62_02230, partial [Arthrobacter sp.]|nr:hypothetical protein [Arthrobacter sp.]